MKSRLIIIILLVFSLSSESQIRRTTIRAFWQTVRNTISGEIPPPPTVEKAFYVSSTGSDSNPGTLELPFQTLDKINSLALTDTSKVYLKRGDSFTGTLTAQSNSITYDAYGSGSKPIIYGSEVITGWTVHSGNIYKATFATDIQQLFLDGEKMQVARLTNTGYNTISSIASQTVFTSNVASQADDYYVGTTVIFRMQNYFSDTRTVTASTGSSLTVSSAPSSTIAADQSILIMNKLEFLDAAGEWYYDTGTNTVYLWTPNGDSPAGYEVRGSTLDAGITINTVGSPYPGNYVTIKNIDFLHQKKAGVRITGTAPIDYLTVTECNFDGQDQYGIYSHTSDFNHGSFSNNTFNKINGAAIFSLNTTAAKISNNTISNIGLMEDWGISNVPYLTDYGFNNMGTGIDISVGGATPISPNVISYNKLYNCGYNGIYYKSETEIHHNYFYGMGLSKSDGGAIYTGSPLSSGSVISYNIIDYVLGEQSGGTLGRYYGFGIYLDENSLNNTVHHNIVMNCSDAAIFTHKPSNHSITDNSLFDSRYGFLYTNTSTGTTEFDNNFVITGSATDDYETRQFLVKKSTTGVTLDGNTYVSGFASDLVFNDGTHRNFSGWQTATSQDAASTYVGTALAGRSQRLVYNNTTDTLKYYLNEATSATDENATAIPDSFLVAPFESKYVRSINVDSISIVKKDIVPIDLTPNLLANYYFTETSGTNSNDLIGTADGTIYGTPTMDGTKYTLDGTDDYVSFPLPTVLSSNQYNSDFSINIKFTVFATPAAAKRLFYQGSSFTRGIQVVLNTNRDIYAIITENDVPATSGKLTSGGIVINTPHNLTITWDATANTLKMYLDGTEITGTTSSNSLNGNSSGMRLGSSVAAAYINADVYELSVFDKKLSDTEVSAWINR